MSVMQRRGIAVGAILPFVLLGPISGANAEEFEVEFPAGEFCPGFAVLGDITVKGSEKTLPGDRFWQHNVGTGIWTNAETGHTFTQRSRYALTETYNEEANDFRVTINGRYLIGLLPDESHSVAGHQTFTFDADTNTIVAYSLDGRVLADVCAVLAGED
ncbi:hypothetical protein [Arthrobacter sp. Rue61a]|uniref:hypothetical protein n=1 Tax=Arthrobacter sp. Rue61a TaxID=1118963 RepID=UPI0002E0D995|nr:hypothetical protein [Arthrobacter sp. Rue61a]